MARNDGIAEWYDERNAAFMKPVTTVMAGPSVAAQGAASRSAAAAASTGQHSSSSAGRSCVDLSGDQLRVARGRMGDIEELLQSDG